MTEPTHEQKLIHYLMNVIRQGARQQGKVKDIEPPDWVPCRIRFDAATAEHLGLEPEMCCVSNVWGAMFVERGEVTRIGIYPHECEIVELRANVKKRLNEESAA